MNQAIEHEFTIRGLTLAASGYGDESCNHKVLALHGWLDCSASFSAIAGRLNAQVIAPDLMGQGLSDNRPLSSTYHLWDDLQDVYLLLQQLQWLNDGVKLTLIGHSRGAMLAVMLAASFPEFVDSVVLLDGILPEPVKHKDTVKKLRQHVLEMTKPERGRRYFNDKEKAIEVRAKAGGFNLQIADALAQRQLLHDGKGWYWAFDDRLKAASAIKLTEQHNTALLDAVVEQKTPLSIVMANQGLARFMDVSGLQQQYPAFNWHFLDGHHHFHLDAERPEQLDKIVALCNECLAADE